MKLRRIRREEWDISLGNLATYSTAATAMQLCEWPFHEWPFREVQLHDIQPGET